VPDSHLLAPQSIAARCAHVSPRDIRLERQSLSDGCYPVAKIDRIRKRRRLPRFAGMDQSSRSIRTVSSCVPNRRTAAAFLALPRT
jgi:hypothetical protein